MVAAAHAAPVYMNKAATIKKTVQLIEQAAAEQIKLLVFPETFIPGYPVGGPYPCELCSNTCNCFHELLIFIVLGRVLPAAETGRCTGKVR
jgi:predicted amidohydrolase